MKWPLLLLLTSRLITVHPPRKLQRVFFIFIYLFILVSPICLVCCVGAECTESGRARADFAAWTQLIVVLRKSHFGHLACEKHEKCWHMIQLLVYKTLAPDWQRSVTEREGQLSPAALVPCLCLCLCFHRSVHKRTHAKSSLGGIFPLTTIIATEAESQNTGLLNIGHVFFPRNQSQIPDMQSAVEVETVQLKWTWQLSVLQMLSR